MSQKNGSITVFFSLTFILILSMVLTLVESARMHGVHACVSEALVCAMDSVLADYYLPLYEEYGLFGHYNKEFGIDHRSEFYEEKIKEYMTYQMSPGINQNNMESSVHTFLTASIHDVKADDYQYLSDIYSHILYDQAIENSKYTIGEDGVKALLSRCGFMKEQKKVTKIYEAQTQVQNKLAKIDEIVIELMELVDGIDFKKGQMQYTKSGNIKIKQDFIKQIISYPITMENVRVRKSEVYQALIGHYINKDSVIVVIQKEIEKVLKNRSEIKKLQEEREPLVEEIKELNERIQSIERECSEISEEDSEEAFHRRSECESLGMRISEVSSKVDEINQKMANLEEQNAERIECVNTSLQDFRNHINGIEKILPLAQEKIKQGMEAKKKAKRDVDQYESYYSSVRGSVSEDSVQRFDEELDDMKEYVEETSLDTLIKYRFDDMLVTIEKNMNVMNQLNRVWIIEQVENDEVVLSSFLEQCQKANPILSSYEIDFLEFDYSSFTFEKKDPGILKHVKGYCTDGLLSLVLEDTSTVSQQTLEQIEQFDAKQDQIQESKKESLNDLQFIDDPTNKEDHNQFLSDGMDLFGEDAILEGLSDKIVDPLLFEHYIREYFKKYSKTDTVRETVNLPSALLYEQEFICFGNRSDRDNLSSMMYRVFFLRLIMQTLILFMDKECNEKARLAATAMLGCTGLPMLITAAKVLILMAWAFEEAVVDTALIMRGKNIDILSKERHFHFEELLTFCKNTIDSKVKSYKPETKLTFSYDELLMIFTLITKQEKQVNRILNIIQANVRMRYDEEFQIHNCITSFQVKVTYSSRNIFALWKPDWIHQGFHRTVALSY